jgi:hypothetical protein
MPSKFTTKPYLFHLLLLNGKLQLGRTCPSSYIFAFLCCLTLICCTNMFLKPNLVYLWGWVQKLLWNCYDALPKLLCQAIHFVNITRHTWWKHIKVFANLFISCSMLTSLRKNMNKKNTLETFIQTYNFTFHKWFQNSCHCIQIWPLIYEICNFYFNPYWLSNYMSYDWLRFDQ